MPPMDYSISPCFETSWLESIDSPHIDSPHAFDSVFDVKAEGGGGFASDPLMGSIPNSIGESCLSKVQQVVCQRAGNGLSSGMHSFHVGNPIDSGSLVQVGLDPLNSSTGNSVQGDDSGSGEFELETVVADEGLSILNQRPLTDHLAHRMYFGARRFPSIDMAAVQNSRPKRRNVKISKDPQSVAARLRREKISDRIRILQSLVPGGTKMDTASMLDEAISYVKVLQLTVVELERISKANAFHTGMRFGSSPMYCNGMAGPPYNGTMGMDYSTASQGFGSVQNDFKEGTLNPFPNFTDGNFPVQFCH